MNNLALLFTSIELSDKRKLVMKAFIASKILRILAIIAIVITLVIAVPIILAGGVLGGTVLAVGTEANTATAVTGGVLAFAIGMFLLFLGLIGQIITLWYTGKIKKQLENNDIPSLVLPYIFLIFTAFGIYGSIKPELNIVGVVLYLCVAYLWFVVINTVSKLKSYS